MACIPTGELLQPLFGLLPRSGPGDQVARQSLRSLISVTKILDVLPGSAGGFQSRGFGRGARIEETRKLLS